MDRQRHLAVFGVAVALALAAVTGGCRDADPVAPSDSLLSITANPPSIPLGGTSRITVIATRGDGVPVVDGTEIKMTSTLGTIPEEIYTTDGFAEATFEGGAQAGEAEITATAGAASAVTTTVRIGSTTSTLTISANPGSLPFGGGSSTITVIAYDENSTPLSGIPVQFSTDKGTLSSGGALLYTNSNGVVQDTLRTEFTATVTATSGGLSPASVTVTVEPEPPDDPGDPPASVVVAAYPNPVAPGQPTSIVATVFSASGAPLQGVGVVFTTTAGSLSSGGGLRYTNSNGQASDTLTTSVNAKVTANAGTKSGSVDVTVSGGATSITITASPANFSSYTDTVYLIATVRDSTGTGLPGQTVNFAFVGTPDMGALSTRLATTDGNGQAFSTITVTFAESDACNNSGVNCTCEVEARSGSLSDTVIVGENFP